jgi:hypothetical protein
VILGRGLHQPKLVKALYSVGEIEPLQPTELTVGANVGTVGTAAEVGASVGKRTNDVGDVVLVEVGTDTGEATGVVPHTGTVPNVKVAIEVQQ